MGLRFSGFGLKGSGFTDLIRSRFRRSGMFLKALSGRTSTAGPLQQSGLKMEFLRRTCRPTCNPTAQSNASAKNKSMEQWTCSGLISPEGLPPSTRRTELREALFHRSSMLPTPNGRHSAVARVFKSKKAIVPLCSPIPGPRSVS